MAFGLFILVRFANYFRNGSRSVFMAKRSNIPVGTQALILSKVYFGVLVKNLEELDIERYFSVLYFLKANNGCSQQYICNNLAVDKTVMVKVLDYLVKNDYVKQETNPQDRREHIVLLTAKGAEKTEEIVKAFKKIDKELFSGVSKAEKEVFFTTLHTLTEKLKKMPGKELFFKYQKTRKTKASLTK